MDRTLLVSSAIGVGAVILLLLRLLDATVTNDEANVVNKSALGWQELFDWLKIEVHPPLYYIYMKLWIGWLGESQAAIRLSSLPFSIGAMIAAAIWFRQVAPPKAAAIAFALFALSPFWIILAGMAKYFSLITFLSVLTVAMMNPLIRRFEQEKRRPADFAMLAIWIAAQTALLYTHYLGIVLSGTLLLMLLYRRSRATLPLTMAIIIAGLIFLPHVQQLVVKVLAAMDDGSSVATHPPFKRLIFQGVYILWSFAAGHTIELTNLLIGLPLVAAWWNATAKGAWQLRKQPQILFLVIATFLGGWFIQWAMLAGHPHVSISERLILFFPFVVLLTAIGIHSLSRRIRFAAIALIAIGYGYSQLSMIRKWENNFWDFLIPWEEISSVVGEHPDAVILFDNRQLGSRGWYYFRQHEGGLIELRGLSESGQIPTAIEALPVDQSVILIRSVRDSTTDKHLEQTSGLLREMRGEAIIESGYVEDSPSMFRLKQLLRRGSDEETYRYKISVTVFGNKNSPLHE